MKRKRAKPLWRFGAVQDERARNRCRQESLIGASGTTGAEPVGIDAGLLCAAEGIDDGGGVSIRTVPVECGGPPSGAGRGRMDEVYEALEAGLRERAPELLSAVVDPRLDAIRKDGRYPILLEAMGIKEIVGRGNL